MHIVMAMAVKVERVNLRIRPEIKEDALAAAEMRGWNLTTLINTLLVDLINQEKKDRPELFADAAKRIAKERMVKVAVAPPSNVKDRGHGTLTRKRAGRKR